MKFINVEDANQEEVTENVIDNSSEKEEVKEEEKQELDFNKTNREDYEKLMEESSTNRDGYWDSNNPFVKILLLILGVVIILGVVYYVFTFMGTR